MLIAKCDTKARPAFVKQERRKSKLEVRLARCRALANEQWGDVTRRHLQELEADLQREIAALAR
jgi:hypothetical protein